MKKIDIKIIYAFILCISAFLLSSCTPAKDNYPWEIGKKSSINIYEDDTIALSLDESMLTENGGEFLLKSEESIRYGEQFFLEVQIDGDWYTIEESSDWFQIGYVLQAGEETLLEIDWTNYYGELPSGRYRIVKPITTSEEEYFISCEFEI